MLYTTKDEIYKHFKRMDGTEKDKIAILTQLNACPESYIKRVIKEMRQKELEEAIAKEQIASAYHPDDNPYCKAETRKRFIPAAVRDSVYKELDTLEEEIKDLEDELKRKYAQFKDLVEFLDGKVGE